MEPSQKIAELTQSLIDALCVEWSDNGNLMADAVRDSCIETLSRILGKSFAEVVEMIESAALDKQE